MQQYLEEAIAEYNEQVQVTVAKPTFFCISEGVTMLSGNSQERFHNVIAKLLYVAQLARPDIVLSVTFLNIRVTRSTEDKKKLIRILQFLKGTMDDELIYRLTTLII
mmetsp:Transcript_17522/g.26815  ORF Transcript_17522/g.26815 Transcript_17522/m.26815 type:complete len:107 (-) Transcript_17522:359-679(-)